MNTILISFAIAVAFLGSLITWPHIVARVLQILFPDIVWEGSHSTNGVALTFDDGPDPIFTPQVLSILKMYSIKATFFLVGKRAERYADVVSEIRTAGHEIGNHSTSWRRTCLLNSRSFEQDLLYAEENLQLKGPAKLFRPAGGLIRRHQLRILRKHGYQCVLGTAYAFDPYRPPPAYITWAIKRALRPGAIIVLHDSGGDRRNTLTALPSIIKAAVSRGLPFCTVSEILPAE